MPIAKPLSPHTRIFSRGPILHGRQDARVPKQPSVSSQDHSGSRPCALGQRSSPRPQRRSWRADVVHLCPRCLDSTETPGPAQVAQDTSGSLVTGGSRDQRSPSPLALPSVSYTMGCAGFGAAFGPVRGPFPRPGTEDGLLPQHVQVQPCGWIWADQAGGAVTTDVLRPAGDPGPRGEQRPRVLGRPSSSCLSPGGAPAGGGRASRARPVNVRAEPMEETPPLSRGHSQRSLCLR